MHGKIIGRFEILSELVNGGQGHVYLAHDPKLARKVAIKILQKNDPVLHEAHLISGLQHPNITTLYDSGEYKGFPYLVYAYIEGKTLAQWLSQEKTVSFVRAAEIACGLLGGLEYAHGQGVFHLDINPANVMMTNLGIPMLMDFGMSASLEKRQHASSLRYRAPEFIISGRRECRADLYAVGTILYEMVTGAYAVPGNSAAEMLAGRDKITAPSQHNPAVDEKLESILFKAIAQNPDERYLSAQAMKAALQNYLGETDLIPVLKGSAHSTLEFLLRRMRNKSDFPALTNIISDINQIVASESESCNKLARTILQDFALTSKLLKLVNAASYGQFGGTINTVSKAVVILGFDTVRNIAMSLLLMDFLQNKAQAVQLKDEVVQSIFTGIVAAQLSVGRNIRNAEEVMVCAMFHNLGRMLATYYFFDESQEICRLIEQGETETQAAIKVLGISYPDLSQAVARSWNFPPRLLAGMKKLPDGKVAEATGDLDYLTVTINLAHDLCEAASSKNGQGKQQVLGELAKRYESAFRVSERELSAAVEVGVIELNARSSILSIGTGKNALLARVRTWSERSALNNFEHRLIDADGVIHLNQAISQSDARLANPEAMLGAGIQDITESLVIDFNLNDVLQMVLETIYRGIGFNRAIFMIRDNKHNEMVAKFGFGIGIDALIPRFHFPLTFAEDVFHLSLEKGLDIAIENINSPTISDKIPAWYKNSIKGQCFILLPVMVKGRAIGLIYADMLTVNSLNVSQQQLSLLRTLRNQAVLAIKTKI